MVLDFEKFERTPRITDPFEYIVVEDFIRREAQAAATRDFPAVPKGGLYTPEQTDIQGGFKAVVGEMTGDRFRDAVAHKFEIDLANYPSMYTIRGHTRTKDGQIHTDSKTKVITVLLYFNENPWTQTGGRLRLLRDGENVDNYAAEIAPSGGTLIVFKRSDRSWHGHPPYEGPRKTIQLNWVTGNDVVARELARHNLSGRMKALNPFGRH